MRFVCSVGQHLEPMHFQAGVTAIGHFLRHFPWTGLVSGHSLTPAPALTVGLGSLEHFPREFTGLWYLGRCSLWESDFSVGITGRAG